MLTFAIFADFLDFENGCCYCTLTQLHEREEKTHGLLTFLFKYIHFFIDYNTSLSYIRMVVREKNILKFADFS